jgi:hypothetical protein
LTTEAGAAADAPTIIVLIVLQTTMVATARCALTLVLRIENIVEIKGTIRGVESTTMMMGTNAGGLTAAKEVVTVAETVTALVLLLPRMISATNRRTMDAKQVWMETDVPLGKIIIATLVVASGVEGGVATIAVGMKALEGDAAGATLVEEEGEEDLDAADRATHVFSRIGPITGGISFGGSAGTGKTRTKDRARLVRGETLRILLPDNPEAKTTRGTGSGSCGRPARSRRPYLPRAAESK